MMRNIYNTKYTVIHIRTTSYILIRSNQRVTSAVLLLSSQEHRVDLLITVPADNFGRIFELPNINDVSC